ncbi:MAG: D-alanyl-D-alanine carboxypeptidase [Clostridia bacterium]|nr:D-alanyl-D-alanine carboxypeptidase [Clostridia bacterium]
MAVKSRLPIAAFRSGILLLLIWLLLFISPFNVFADMSAWVASETPPEESRVGAAYLYNLDTGLVLYSKAADQTIYPTSAVKIMTGLIACQQLADRTEELVDITAPMLAGASGRNMGLVVGEKMKIYDLLMAAVCGSYNDAACVVAYLSAGSVDAFVEQMNREAERLGALKTVYKNVTGLHDPAMVTTAAETALVARAALSNELFMSLASTHVHTIPATNASDARTLTNRNALVSDTGGQYYNGWCRGMNAGMTDEGGWCVITVWEKNGATNLSVVMNAADVGVGETIPAYSYTNRLLSWAGRCYGYRTVLTADEVLDTLPVSMTGISKSETDVLVPDDLKAFLPTHADISTQVTLQQHITGGELTAPLTEGQVVGTVTVTYGGQVVGSSDLVVMEEFERNGFLDGMKGFKGYLTSRPFLITVVCFAVTLVLYLRYVTGPGSRYSTRQVYTPPKRRNKKYRALRSANTKFRKR